MHLFGDGSYYMGGMHGSWWIFWVLLVGALVLLVWLKPGAQRRQPGETPHQILQRRLARGEIDAAEYTQRKALLDRDAAPEP